MQPYYSLPYCNYDNSAILKRITHSKSWPRTLSRSHNGIQRKISKRPRNTKSDERYTIRSDIGRSLPNICSNSTLVNQFCNWRSECSMLHWNQKRSRADLYWNQKRCEHPWSVRALDYSACSWNWLKLLVCTLRTNQGNMVSETDSHRNHEKIWADLHWNLKYLSNCTLESEKIRADLHWNQNRSEHIYFGIRKDPNRSTLESQKIRTDLYWNQKRSEQITTKESSKIGTESTLKICQDLSKIYLWIRNDAAYLIIGICTKISIGIRNALSCYYTIVKSDKDLSLFVFLSWHTQLTMIYMWNQNTILSEQIWADLQWNWNIVYRM